MTRNGKTPVQDNRSTLEQIDLDDMDQVGGGCQCASKGKKNDMTTFAPMLMAMASRR